MIRLLRSAASEPGVTLIPELTREQVAAIHAGIPLDVRSRQHLDSCEPKFRGELGSCILWLLVRAMQLTGLQSLEVFAGINRRESLGSTGVGRGFGVPHTKTEWVLETRICSVLFRDQRFEYDAIDQEPIQGICLVLGKPSKPGEYLRVDKRSPVKLLCELEEGGNPEAYQESMIRNFGLREPLIEEWHSPRLGPDVMKSELANKET